MEKIYRFNATTAFLLRGFPEPQRRCSDEFQCHHGVPASSLRVVTLSSGRGFNATTAFLLR